MKLKITFFAALFLLISILPAFAANSTEKSGAVWWGDSLTAGAGGNGVTAPGELSKLLGRTVINRGVGGEGSSEIAVRAGAKKMRVKFWGSGKKEGDWVTYQVVPDRNLLRQGANVIAGNIGTCLAILKYDGASYFMKLFKCKQNMRDSLKDFQLVGLENLNYKYQIIWAGRNNGGDSITVASDVQSMIDTFRKRNSKVKILVLSVINGEGEGLGTGAYVGIQNVNDALSKLSANFVDVRKCLVQDAIKLEKLTPSPQDLVDIQNDLVPSQLRSDGIHLNSYGYHAVATCTSKVIKEIS